MRSRLNHIERYRRRIVIFIIECDGRSVDMFVRILPDNFIFVKTIFFLKYIIGCGSRSSRCSRRTVFNPKSVTRVTLLIIDTVLGVGGGKKTEIAKSMKTARYELATTAKISVLKSHFRTLTKLAETRKNDSKTVQNSEIFDNFSKIF